MNHVTQRATVGAHDVRGGPLRVLLISTYELGRQPFSLASPAAWLVADGAVVETVDLAVEELSRESLQRAHLIAFSVPMHTATRLALHHMPAVRAANPGAVICCFGLYAAMNEDALRAGGAEFVLAGEYEEGLVQVASLVRARRAGAAAPGPAPAAVSTARQQFLVPRRTGLPALDQYARVVTAGGERLVGATEATRGCKHLCRHCPIVPVYGGRFRVVQRDIVMADIRQQVQAGAQHITFGDPDFLNGPAHSMAIVRALHEEFPSLTYDVTIKIEHLRKHDRLLPVLRDTGCLFVTSAVESFDERTLDALEKNHTKHDVARVVQRFRELGLHLSPTFVPFTPWTTKQNYLDLLETVADLGLAGSVAPVQYSIRLLIPAGSRLLELPFMRTCTEAFDPASLAYPWVHPDAGVDHLHARVLDIVDRAVSDGADRASVFADLWAETTRAIGGPALRTAPPLRPAAEMIPYVTEPWYCCAEPTERQLARSQVADGGYAASGPGQLADGPAGRSPDCRDAPQDPDLTGRVPAVRGSGGAARPADELIQQVRLAAFRRLLEGQPATVMYLSERLRITGHEAGEAVKALVEAHRGAADSEGNVVGAGGLSLAETSHSLRIRDGASLWCWCAWDTLGISSALHLTSDISTPCGSCGQEIRVSAVRGEVTGSEFVHGYIPVPKGSPLSCFCPYALLFCSAEHLTSWRAALPPGVADGGRSLPLAAYAAEACHGWGWASG